MGELGPSAVHPAPLCPWLGDRNKPRDKSNTYHSLVELEDTCLGGMIHVHVHMRKTKQAEEQEVTCPKPKVTWSVSAGTGINQVWCTAFPLQVQRLEGKQRWLLGPGLGV